MNQKKSSTNIDTIYAETQERIEQFRFDEKVTAVFPDMIQRSVPGYLLIQDMIGVLAKRYGQRNTHVYDLGCSLGASSLSMLANLSDKTTKLIGIDNSTAMIKGASHALDIFCKEQHIQNTYQLVCANIQDYPYQNASIINLNFTLQFIPPSERLGLIQALFKALTPGGILILSEKVCFADKEDALQNDLHHAFKKANGYSDLEISQKRSALEDVLIRDSEAEHHARLKKAGFQQSITWFQCFNFMSLLAIKS